MSDTENNAGPAALHQAVHRALKSRKAMSQQQTVASPLEQAQMCIRAAMQEKSRLMAMLSILVQRSDNSVVITFGELEALDPDTELLQSDPTAVGFTLSTRVVIKQ